jgi:SAM-dependent methyltransferase
MLAWYQAQLSEHGFVAATALLARVVRARAVAALANELLPARVECPCCGWRGRRFYDYIEAGFAERRVECPQCNSHPRHRAFAVWLRRDYRLESKRGAALVFAPERALESVWDSAAVLKVLKTDIEPSRGVDLLADIQRLPFASDSFDLVWCQHVLTQIPDDRAAIGEMRRVLRARVGELIVSVSQTPGARTREFGEGERRPLGFKRIYGDDFAERLAAGGLEARAGAHGLSADECARYGVDSGESFFVCTKPASS